MGRDKKVPVEHCEVRTVDPAIVLIHLVHSTLVHVPLVCLMEGNMQ